MIDFVSLGLQSIDVLFKYTWVNKYQWLAVASVFNGAVMM